MTIRSLWLFPKSGCARRWVIVAAVALSMVVLMTLSAQSEEKLNRHRVVLDDHGKIISWVEPRDKAYTEVTRRAWNFLLNDVPIEKNGLKTFYTYCCMDMDGQHGTEWAHNPASLYASLVDSATAWYAFSADGRVIDLVRGLLDYQLAHGTTPGAWKWSRVPYASSSHSDTEYRGANDRQYNPELDAIGDGYGVIEPDKVGELGLGYLKFWMATGDTKYRDAALACADALAKNVREGMWSQSPWPFRVYAETGYVREDYSANVIGPIKLLDELVRLKLGDYAAYQRTREMAWNWLMKFPMKDGYWSAYFEDVSWQRFPNNLNQYSPMETSRYIMQHPELDPDWRTHVPALIDYVEKHFVIDIPNEPAVQWGANAVSEQVADMNKMGSHTARYASINAMWYELTGDAAAKEKAFRSFNWASYMCRDNGVVNVGPVDQSLWFSDGYGDYIRHFMAGMGAVPEWAPAHENHLLRSTSIVTSVVYDPDAVRYKTFDKESREVLRLTFTPRTLMAGSQPLRRGVDWTFDPSTGVLHIQHSNANDVLIQ